MVRLRDLGNQPDLIVLAQQIRQFGRIEPFFGRLEFGQRPPAVAEHHRGFLVIGTQRLPLLVLLAYALYYDHRNKTGLRNAARLPSSVRVRKLVRLGLPAATQFGLEVGVFAVATALIARLGAVPLASHQVALNTVSCTYMVPLGISAAAAVRVGQGLGRHDAAAASRAGWTAMLLGTTFMGCMALALFLFPGAIVRIYTADVALIPPATTLLFVAAFFQLFDGMQTVATGALRGAGDTRTPMLCHLIFYWLVGLPLGAYLCFHLGWGAPGLWTGLSVALIFIGIALLYFWRRKEKSFATMTFSMPKDLPAANPSAS